MQPKGLILGSSVLAAVCSLAIAASAQTANVIAATAATGSTSVIPRLINYSGVLKDAEGKTLTSISGVTFLLYKDEQGGAPLWLETQNITPDRTGHYSVQLGATSANGLPSDLFVSGEARWLALQVANEREQERVLLVAVPYAMKAQDAETIGGLPPSAFVLTTPSGIDRGGSTIAVTGPTPTALGGGGATDFVPLWTSSSNLGSSIMFENPSALRVGINTTTPATTLDVKGSGTIRGLFSLPAVGTATATAGTASQALNWTASTFNSGTGKAVNQSFELQAEPVNNNKTTASGTLNLLFGQGTATPAETGLRIASTGLITFAPGQTFPGTGTITGVTAGTDLTGGGTTGIVTLKLDTTKVPQLAAANVFTANQTVKGTLSASSSSGTGVAGTSGSGSGVTGTSTSAIGVLGSSSTNVGVYGTSGSYIGLFGQSTSNYGVYGTSSTSYGAVGVSTSANGIYGQGANIGVTGVSTSPFVNSGWGVVGQSSNNVGVYGSSAGASSTGASLGADAGVWGDTGNTSAFTYSGVVGTADNAQGGAFYNNGISYAALTAANFDATSSAIVLSAGLSSFCITDFGGNLFCTGSKSAIVPVEKQSRQVALYAVEAPENWFEDVGSARLTNGEATVKVEPIFGQTVNTDIEYHVFLTPKGDCKGLYIAQESRSSFVVRELGGGVSSIAFDYRIMAKRKGYESMRLADKTKQFQEQQTRVQVMRNMRAKPAGKSTLRAPIHQAEGQEQRR